MTFTFRQLELFSAAAIDCNFRRTSERLGISQPSISNQIRALEQHLGYHLFERRRGATPRLSSDGFAFLAKAKALIDARVELDLDQAVSAAGRPVHLKVAIGPLLLENVIRPALPQLYELHPRIDIDFIPFSQEHETAELVRNGEIDAAIYTADFPSSTDDVEVELIARVGCSLYGARKLSKRIGKTPASIANMAFILPPESYYATQWIKRMLGEAGVFPARIVARPQFPDTIVRMVLDGKGLSLFFDDMMEKHLRAGRIRRYGPPLNDAYRVMVLGRLAKQAAAAPAMNFFRRLLRQRPRNLNSHPRRNR